MSAAVTGTVGEVLIALLHAHGVEIVFGIPGVHTVELYRGLAASPIRHVTPRHEQGAGFMADGYARVSGKPGVCLVITGPGLTNILTAMAQARQDSVPMLVISGVNRRASLGHGRGALHELPDQRGLMRTVALWSHTLLHAPDLPDVVARAFARCTAGRPGPVHIEIPLDVMAEPIGALIAPPRPMGRSAADPAALAAAAAACRAARAPVILAGGGARRADAGLRRLAERLDAPVVTTTNGRGLLAGHPLAVPASPSLGAVRTLLAGADLVLALGTEFGATDYDVYEDGGVPSMPNLVRVDIDADQLDRGPAARVPILAAVEAVAPALADALDPIPPDSTGAARARDARRAAYAELGPKLQRDVAVLDAIRAALPGVIIVGDSTQLVYAGNLYCAAEAPGTWFNSATGYGALGYGPPAAIGARLAAGDRPVVCIVGDGGLQFALAEIGSAVDAAAPVIFLVWNNHGYREIETFMLAAGVTPEGVRPTAPDFVKIAEAYGVAGERIDRLDHLAPSLRRLAARGRPALIELAETLLSDVPDRPLEG